MQVSCRLVDQASRASEWDEDTSLVQKQVAESPKGCEIKEWRVPLGTQRPHTGGRLAFSGDISYRAGTQLYGRAGQPCRLFLHVQLV